jgi:hypothetical protein
MVLRLEHQSCHQPEEHRYLISRNWIQYDVPIMVKQVQQVVMDSYEQLVLEGTLRPVSVHK